MTLPLITFPVLIVSFFVVNKLSCSRISWEDHFCSVINSTDKHVQLQGISVDPTHLYLLHDDNLYVLPLSNLKESLPNGTVLYMYNLKTKQTIWPIKWYNTAMRVLPTAASNGSFSARYREVNKPGLLKAFHGFIVNQKGTSGVASSSPYLHSYVFKGANESTYEEFLLDKSTGKMIYDANDTNKTGNPEEDYRLVARHLPFRAVTAHTTKGYIFHYDLTDVEAKMRNLEKRVIIDRAYKTTASKDNKGDFINFPLNCTTANCRKETGAYMRVNAGNNQRTEILLANPHSDLARGNANGDFFMKLPFGFINKDNQVFLFSEANQRVYRLEYVHLKFDVVLPLLPIIESKAWREFFICSPTQQLRGKSEQAPEPSLGEYLSAVRAWEVHGNQAEESVLTTGQKVSVIAFGGFLAIVVIVIGLRVRKLRHLNIRAYSSMLKTRLEKSAENTDSSTSTNTGKNKNSKKTKQKTEKKSKLTETTQTQKKSYPEKMNKSIRFVKMEIDASRAVLKKRSQPH